MNLLRLLKLFGACQRVAITGAKHGDAPAHIEIIMVNDLWLILDPRLGIISLSTSTKDDINLLDVRLP
jgi:hypothetical protein